MNLYNLITWNINSIKQRFDLLKQLVAEYKPIIILLQEVRVSDSAIHEFNLPGYHSYWSLNASKGYAGVGILSTVPLQVVYEYKSRVLIAYSAEHNMHFGSVYMYNGRSLSAPLEKKLALYEILYEECSKHTQIVMGGDWNACHDHECSKCINPHYEVEIQALSKLENLLTPVIDVYKHNSLNPYITWWHYVSAAFNNNVGLGLDKFLTNIPNRKQSRVLYAYRRRGKTIPSDHAPVLLQIME
jgi:exodeoxyribonuclease-3